MFGQTDLCLDRQTHVQTDNLKERDDLSVGEDLETFIKRIKNGGITKETLPGGKEEKELHLLCLLDKEERRKLDTKDRKF